MLSSIGIADLERMIQYFSYLISMCGMVWHWVLLPIPSLMCQWKAICCKVYFKNQGNNKRFTYMCDIYVYCKLWSFLPVCLTANWNTYWKLAEIEVKIGMLILVKLLSASKVSFARLSVHFTILSLFQLPIFRNVLCVL